jgi:hypothetical protein
MVFKYDYCGKDISTTDAAGIYSTAQSDAFLTIPCSLTENFTMLLVGVLQSFGSIFCILQARTSGTYNHQPFMLHMLVDYDYCNFCLFLYIIRMGNKRSALGLQQLPWLSGIAEIKDVV